MALWCKDLPVVDVERSTVAKTVTLVMPYYDNPHFFAGQLARLNALPPHVQDHIRVIVVDDGSPETPASRVALGLRTRYSLRVFRIREDRRWNWLAARNIGAHEAPEGWLLLTDMDHVVPLETWDAVIFGVHDSRVAYAFGRREHTGVEIPPHSASFLMTRARFWHVGGYDEALAGYYGTDGDYRRRLAKSTRIEVLRAVLERHEFVDDSSTRRYQRKQPEDARVGLLIAQRPKHWKPKTLTFAYAEARLC
jgi:hypothetical protein